MTTVDDDAVGDPNGRVWGEVPAVPEGTCFTSRREVFDRGVHRQLQAGIAGTGKRGAESIVVSGGYEDVDEREWILYTGHGGQEGRKHVKDQTFDSPGNAALVTSRVNGTPVRVIRGAKTKFGPETGYRYDGLFLVVDSFYERGKDGFKVCRFLMVKAGIRVDILFPNVDAVLSGEQHHRSMPDGNETPKRRASEVRSVVRSLEVADYVKQVHNHTCQVCGVRLTVGDRGYAEGAHIQAVGGVQRGPDVVENLLCLCPNCHALFDLGAILVHEDRSLTYNGQPAGNLRMDDRHPVADKYLVYHREAHAT